VQSNRYDCTNVLSKRCDARLLVYHVDVGLKQAQKLTSRFELRPTKELVMDAIQEIEQLYENRSE